MTRAWPTVRTALLHTRFALLLLTVAVVAAGSCLLTGRWVASRHAASSAPGAAAAHQWIHRELGITPEQEQALQPIEAKYAARRDELMAAIHQANAELARAIREDRADSPNVSAAVDKIHHAQGELQKVTLQHVFEMRSALSPAQYDNLLNQTATALEADGR